MEAEFTLANPRFLAEPFTHKRVLLYSPHRQMMLTECDMESNSRFYNRPFMQPLRWG
ncbi:MAG: hypothetical protein KTR16_10885 [Acidiferrobacterales bacterium]|nr:hypothetical protein [Acidiferrobacterales bacterium]